MTKLAPISEKRKKKLLEHAKEILKALKEGNKYLDRKDIKIN